MKRVNELVDIIFTVTDCNGVSSLASGEIVVKLKPASGIDADGLKSKLVEAGFTKEESERVTFKF